MPKRRRIFQSALHDTPPRRPCHLLCLRHHNGSLRWGGWEGRRGERRRPWTRVDLTARFHLLLATHPVFSHAITYHHPLSRAHSNEPPSLSPPHIVYRRIEAGQFSSGPLHQPIGIGRVRSGLTAPTHWKPTLTSQLIELMSLNELGRTEQHK